jgi:CheY-like chemotaxis protein
MRKPCFKILIADDDPDDQLFILEALRDLEISFDPVSVFNGKQLLDYLQNKDAFDNRGNIVPDFIILDINMPVQNGWDALKEIKSILSLKNIPVYILSTSCSLAEKEIATHLGVVRCFVKPSSFDGMKDIISEMLCVVSESIV